MCESCSVVSNSLRPHELYSPWNSPSQNTGVGSRSLLQGIFPTQGSNPGVLHCRPILYQLSHQGSPDIQTCPTLGCGLVPLVAVIHWAYLSLGMIPASSVVISPLSITLLHSHPAFSPVCPGEQGWRRTRANRIIAECAFL